MASETERSDATVMRLLSPQGGDINGNGDWKAGDKQPPPHGTDVASFRPEEAPGPGKCYPLIISAYVPRPIALVSTVDAAGAVNLAPYSYSGAVSHDPPCIAFSCCRKGAGGPRKDTCANVEANGECVIHVMSEWFVEAANHTCGNYAPEEDEFDLSGLTKVASQLVAPPRCAEAAVAMECKVRHTHEIANASGAVTATVVIAEVVMFHIHEAVFERGPDGAGPYTVSLEKLKPVSRLGGCTYGTTTQVYDLPRPDKRK